MFLTLTQANLNIVNAPHNHGAGSFTAGASDYVRPKNTLFFPSLRPDHVIQSSFISTIIDNNQDHIFQGGTFTGTLTSNGGFNWGDVPVGIMHWWVKSNVSGLPSNWAFIVMSSNQQNNLFDLFAVIGTDYELVMDQQPSTSLTPEITTLWVMPLDLLVLVHLHL